MAESVATAGQGKITGPWADHPAVSRAEQDAAMRQ
jgi:hypothetical protein